ncbi:membrane protease YdiL (CAAX protease family) [Microbacterium sp. W4I20]|nr:membrane protease YdiL (CAAX protease family) [Microbacterium sp. W4I20]
MTSMKNNTVKVEASTDTERRPQWLELVIALVAAVLIYGVGIALLGIFPAPTPALEGVVGLFFSGAAPILVFAIVVLSRIRDLSAFGVRRVSPRWLLIAVLLAAACFAVILTFDTVIQHLYPGIDDSQDTLRAAASGGVLALVGTIFFGAVLTPLGEELLFRGILTRFFERWGAWVAIVVSALIFAVWHGINLVFPSALLVGLINGWLMVRTKSVWPGVVLHIVYNSAFLILYSFS